MITRRDWWLGIAVVLLALLFHATFPRYDWRQQEGAFWLRVDRWTGNAELVLVVNATPGRRFPLR